MAHVYLILQAIDYEGSSPICVYDSYKAAVDHLRTLREEDGGRIHEESDTVPEDGLKLAWYEPYIGSYVQYVIEEFEVKTS